MQPAAIWLLAGLAGVVAFAAGVAFGRSASRRTAARARELEARLGAAEEEMARYRSQVSEHFSETSTLLRDLTLQYRSVYEHLAEGARTLCPEGVQLLAPSLAEAAQPDATSIAPAEEPAAGDGREVGRSVPAAEPDALGPLLDEAEPGWSSTASAPR